MYKIVKEYLKTNGMLKPVVLEEVLAPGGNEGYLLTIEGDNMVIGDYFSNHTFTVDWGDGAVLSYENEYIVTHDYNTTGVYNIVIFDYVCGSLNMPNTGVISINTAMPKVNYTDFSGMFQNCGRLATVCDDLFYNNHQAENFGRMFLNCFSLKEIPAGLFKRCEKLTSLDGMFRNCYLITDIPHGILSQNPLIESVANMFDSCVSLQNVPSDLFYHNPLIYNFS
ncbi:MAG: hypothetical protein LBU94_03155, partial [Clostridiales bacterium]|nr:hypothetical protein [Clostridiales bacterium]